MKKIIKYFSEHPYIKNDFTLSKKVIPQWYKSVPGNEHNSETNIFPIENTVKKCIPFFDAISSGYMVTTNMDIAIGINQGSVTITWASEDTRLTRIISRDTQNHVPAPEGYAQDHLAWYMPYSLKTPAGYSVLVTHPFNRFDLPFMTTSAIVDSDTIMIGGFIPFFLKKGWYGIIPQGTPIAQIIPFKRDSWQSEWDDSIKDESEKIKFNINRMSSSFYKKSAWKRKDYN